MKRPIACAVGLVLAAAAGAEPYRSDLRSQFERDVDRPEPTLGWFVQPRVESAVYLVGNINLAQEGSGEERQDMAGVELAPGLYASYNGGRAQGFIDWSLIGRAWEDSDYDEVTQRLAASGSYLAVPDWFQVGAQATYTDGVVDPTQSFNYGGMGVFDPTNNNERMAASVTPQITHQFQHVLFNANYTYGRVWYFDDEADPTRLIYSLYQDDSVDQAASVSLTTDRDRDFWARAYYDWTYSNFTLTVDYRYDRAGVDFGRQLTRTLQLIGSVGLESDLNKSTTAGGLESDFWNAGLSWRPDSRTSVEATGGQRYFGNSWSLAASRDTRWVTMRISYIEEPTVETRRIGVNFNPDELPLPVPGDDLSGFTSFPYVRRDFDATFIVEGAKTKIRLGAYDRNRDYVNKYPPDEHRKGVTLSVLRDLGNFLYGEIETRYDDIESGVRNPTLPDIVDDELIYHYYDWDIVGRVTWQAYPNFDCSVEAGYLNRSGSFNYNGEWMAFRLRYTF